MANQTYKSEVNTRYLEKTKELLNIMPQYCVNFINSKNHVLSARTRCAYTQDLIIFLNFIKQTNPLYKDKEISQIDLKCIASLKATDIEEFLAYVESYWYNGKHYENGIQGKQRKLAAVRELYKYLCRIDVLKSNPAALVETPKLKSDEKAVRTIRALDDDEKKNFINAVSDDNMAISKRQKEMKELLEKRDLAIIYLFLGTGIRVSELVGLNLDDVDFRIDVISVLGKGNKYTMHYFNQQIRESLLSYLEECRPRLSPLSDEMAVFLSRRGTRITVRSVERLVKKYADFGIGKKNGITPHKLRSTYGTDLYAATGDIALVSDNLGHADISTTKRYYAKQNIENLKKNKNFII